MFTSLTRFSYETNVLRVGSCQRRKSEFYLSLIPGAGRGLMNLGL